MKHKTIREAREEKTAMTRSKQLERIAIEEDYLARARLECARWTETATESEIRLVADNMMLTEGHSPLSFTGWSDCERCGVMPNDSPFRGEKVLACPWCHTTFGVKKIIEQTTKELEDYERFGSTEYRAWRERNPDIAARHDLEEMSDS